MTTAIWLKASWGCAAIPRLESPFIVHLAIPHNFASYQLPHGNTYHSKRAYASLDFASERSAADPNEVIVLMVRALRAMACSGVFAGWKKLQPFPSSLTILDSTALHFPVSQGVMAQALSSQLVIYLFFEPSDALAFGPGSPGITSILE